jgi:DNA ligase 1
MSNLESLNRMCLELNTTNSNTDKLEILKRYPENKELLEYTYNPFKKFHVTSDALKKKSELQAAMSCHSDIKMLLDDLTTSNISGNNATSYCNAFIADNKEYTELIYNIIDKNLKTRTDVKTINSVYPDLIPEFKVALANTYEGGIDFEAEEWYSSRKLDGCRCITIIKDGVINFYSREGHEFLTLNNLKPTIQDLIENFGSLVLDGEICITDENGNEDFKSIMKEIKKKDHTIKHPTYIVFDMLRLDEFYGREKSEKLIERVVWREDHKNIKIVKQTLVKNEEHLSELIAEADEKGWEGLIIRKNIPYEGKRSKAMLKVKKFKDAEFKVKALRNGPFRITNKTTGLEETIETLSAITIEYKGNDVDVGSGFSLEQRKRYYEHPEFLLNKTVTVKYFAEIETNGKYSLRFPTIKHVYKEERDI